MLYHNEGEVGFQNEEDYMGWKLYTTTTTTTNPFDGSLVASDDDEGV
jgi:hypothetical protein